MSPDFTSSALSVFADECTEFAVTVFSDSLSVVWGDFNSFDCMFFTSLGHKNVVGFPTRLDDNLDFAFINDVGIYLTRKVLRFLFWITVLFVFYPEVYGKHGTSTLLHQTKKDIYRNYLEENIRNLQNMFHTTNW